MIKNKIFLVFTTIFLLNVCFNNPTFSIEETNLKTTYPDYSYEFTGKDQWESFNRKIFVFNIKANKYLIRPVNVVWASIMPKYGMDRIQNFYTNINYPVRLVGSLLQGDFESSGIETKRFFINTTMGLIGLYDPALNKFKIEPRKEDMEQVLAYHKVKQGPYLILPIVARGNVRDIAGQILDLPLNPCSYIVGPVTLASTGLSLLNDITYMQPLFKMADNYADPYETSKQLDGIEQYIKNANIDRRNFITETNIAKNFVNINNSTNKNKLNADINLVAYNPQNRETDAMRTILFDSQKIENSTWSELSIWNKSFNNKLKTSSINIDAQKPNYKYRYILQKNKSAPVAILYPSIGEGIKSNQSSVLAKILYNEGYSVIIIGSSFNWAFVKSMPDNFKPGFPYEDAHYLRIVTSMIVNQLQGKYKTKFDKKILVGTSFGGLTGMFVAAQEKKENTLGISNYIFICPPIQPFYALQQIDNFSQNSAKNTENLKETVAVTSEKLIQVTYNDYNQNSPNNIVALPFNEDEAKLAISYTMRQKLYDLIFTIEKGDISKKNNIYNMVANMSFYNYAEKYLLSNQNKSTQQLTYDSSLYAIDDFLRENNNYKIYHSLDDCFTTPEQLIWLKNQTKNKTLLFSNGSHLGFLYRKEFFDEFLKDIKINL